MHQYIREYMELGRANAIRDILNDGGTAYTDMETKLTKVVDGEGDLCHCWCDAPRAEPMCTCDDDPDSHCPIHGMTRPAMNRYHQHLRDDREGERRAEQRMEDYYGGFVD